MRYLFARIVLAVRHLTTDRSLPLYQRALALDVLRDHHSTKGLRDAWESYNLETDLLYDTPRVLRPFHFAFLFFLTDAYKDDVS